MVRFIAQLIGNTIFFFETCLFSLSFTQIARQVTEVLTMLERGPQQYLERLARGGIFSPLTPTPIHVQTFQMQNWSTPTTIVGIRRVQFKDLGATQLIQQWNLKHVDFQCALEKVKHVETKDNYVLFLY